MTPATRRGLGLAAGIVLGWLGSWLLLLPSDCRALPPALVVAAVAGRTLLQTGLFIVAHDAMHRSLWPGKPRWNRRLGQLALALYGALPYGRCLRNHRRHHRHSGTSQDPDHHLEGCAGFLAWYGRFMGAYLSVGQLGLLVAGWSVLVVAGYLASATALANVLLYGALPILLSSLQLFVVGTYLPHGSTDAVQAGKASSEGGDGHGPRSLDWPEWLSLLGCFHFGYHWEHHAHPGLPWHKLPEARRRREAVAGP